MDRREGLSDNSIQRPALRAAADADRWAVERDNLPCVHTTCILGIATGDLQFEGDTAKATANARRHGVTFEEAQTVFFDDLALLIDDPDHSETEARFVLLGLSASARILVVVHAYPSAPDTVRIISARKATKTERAGYTKRPRP